MRLSLLPATALLIALAACGPSDPIAHQPADHDESAINADRAPKPLPAPVKPVLPPDPLPEGVTREVLPDGSVRITIREPRCPSCQPWVF